jgi:hypothetical protein
MKKLLIPFLMVFFGWLMFQFPKLMVNPGTLSASHQKLNSKCTACHEVFWGVPNAKCIACHKLKDIGRDSLGQIKKDELGEKVLFHEALSEQRCTDCHAEHKGSDVISSKTDFNHTLLPATIGNLCEKCHRKPTDKLHSRLSSSCTNCHGTSGWKNNIVFNHSMIQGGNEKCVDCHTKPGDNLHATFYDNCAKCHGTDKWKPATFEHSSYFGLDKDHNVECKICHSSPDFSQYSCYGCHEHTPAKLREEHNEEGIYDFDKCISCHKSANKHDIKGNGGGKSEGDRHEDDD